MQLQLDSEEKIRLNLLRSLPICRSKGGLLSSEQMVFIANPGDQTTNLDIEALDFPAGMVRLF
jgi:hypothetical protein